ncbi:hypothetical protein L1987_11272 [Smallanthus sonchifolius]|uniref:Uncharacterized protein n=1 Tax=Smallanthus sonchifolius TaxID=185202 RepID=A0ACB9JCJ9_9ASTR|nr:hypothetical protein L1987_11272 [Smallanthus sonchifolius]
MKPSSLHGATQYLQRSQDEQRHKFPDFRADTVRQRLRLLRCSATNGFFSKYYCDIRIHEEQAASAKAAVDKLINTVVSFPLQTASDSSSSSGSEPLPAPVDVEVKEKTSNRCLTCNKKVGVIGFKCRCGDTFYGSHRIITAKMVEMGHRKKEAKQQLLLLPCLLPPFSLSFLHQHSTSTSPHVIIRVSSPSILIPYSTDKPPRSAQIPTRSDHLTVYCTPICLYIRYYG